MLEFEQVEENFTTFTDLCNKLGKRKEHAVALVEHFGERLASCPAATKSVFPGAYPGGLIEQNLKVLKNALALNSSFELGVKKTSILLCSLFRNIGFLGTKDDELMIEQESEWHRNTLSQMYKYNQHIDFMTPVDRTTFLLQEFGFALSRDEFLALRLSGTRINEEYNMNEGKLGFLIYTASRLAIYEDEK